MAAVKELQRDLENKANDLNKLQKGFFNTSPRRHIYYFLYPLLSQLFVYKRADIAKNHQVRKKYTIQLGENELVLKVTFLSSYFFL